MAIGDELCFDTVQLVSDAAARGLGMAIGRLPLISPQLKSGRLIAAVEQPIESESGYWLVRPLRQETRAAVKVFRKWLLEEASEAVQALEHR